MNARLSQLLDVYAQPYSNGQLPNLTIRSEMLTLVLGLPVQVDHLKRSGIGVIVMGLLKSQQVRACRSSLAVSAGRVRKRSITVASVNTRTVYRKTSE